MKILIIFLMFLVACGEKKEEHNHSQTETDSITNTTIWTCSMHPQVRLPKPGLCPICRMDLIPLVEDTSEEGNEREIKMSESAMKLAEIQTTKIERKFVDVEVRMVGKIVLDETKVKTISAWTNGRLERLFVDYTGVRVRKGDHLVEIYSPELVSAQEEFLQTFQFANSESQKKSARKKLEILGVSSEQIQELEKTKKVKQNLIVNSEIDGIVIHKSATEGIYVKEGSPLYQIADFSKVWVFLDAYESDLQFLHYGQKVEFSVTAFPSEVFTGRVAFIEPTLNPKTRTVKVRLNVVNKDEKLKPEMFVKATLKATVTEDGSVIENSLEGKWISPMHPEIVKNNPGNCDICGMSLVKAEKLGFADKEQKTHAPLVVPKSAVLITGKRAIVYVKVTNKNEPTFEGREVNLGVRAGDFYVIKNGLQEGEEVVTNGAFKIDSALQIVAKPSMMSENRPDRFLKPVRSETLNANSPLEFRKQISISLESYFSLQKALSKDQSKHSKHLAKNILADFEDCNIELLDKLNRTKWFNLIAQLRKDSEHFSHSEDLETQRKYFSPFSQTITKIVKMFGAENVVFIAKCPMAFGNKGATWLAERSEIENPYFGSRMFSCGEILEKIE
ncbi:MAG: DUF3347 domain-containing protein [Calditrichaeota bacterium]|nr:MAG: DUF3347 domain-containing protein [Calditrichota bacterium]